MPHRLRVSILALLPVAAVAQFGDAPCTGEHVKALLENKIGDIGPACMVCAMSQSQAGANGLHTCIPEGQLCTPSDEMLWEEGERCESEKSDKARALCIQGFARMLSSSCTACIARVALSPSGDCGFDPADIMSREKRFDEKVIIGCTRVKSVCLSGVTQAPTSPAPAGSDLAGGCTVADARKFLSSESLSSSFASSTCTGCIVANGAGGDIAKCLPAVHTGTCTAAAVGAVVAAQQCDSSVCRSQLLDSIGDDCAVCLVVATLTAKNVGSSEHVMGMASCMDKTEDGQCEASDMEAFQKGAEDNAKPSCLSCMLGRMSTPDTMYGCFSTKGTCTAADVQLLAGAKSCVQVTESERQSCIERTANQVSGGCSVCVSREATKPGKPCGVSTMEFMMGQDPDAFFKVVDCPVLQHACFPAGTTPPPAQLPPTPPPTSAGACTGDDVRNIVQGGIEASEACYQCVDAFEETDQLYTCVKPELRCSSADLPTWEEAEHCQAQFGEDAGLCASSFSEELGADCFACMLRAALAPGVGGTPPCGVSAEKLIEDERFDIIFSCAAVKAACGISGEASVPAPPPEAIPSDLQGTCDGAAVKRFVMSRIEGETSLEKLRIGSACEKCVTMAFRGSPSDIHKCIDPNPTCSPQDILDWNLGVTCEQQLKAHADSTCARNFAAKISDGCHACVVRTALGPDAPCGTESTHFFSDELKMEDQIIVDCAKVKEACHIQKGAPAPSSVTVVKGSCTGAAAGYFAQGMWDENELGKDCLDCLTKSPSDKVFECIDSNSHCPKQDGRLLIQANECDKLKDAAGVHDAVSEKFQCAMDVLQEMQGSCAACVLRTALSPECPNVDVKLLYTELVSRRLNQSIFGCPAAKKCIQDAHGGTLTPARPLAWCLKDDVDHLAANRIEKVSLSCTQCLYDSKPADRFLCFPSAAVRDRGCDGSDAVLWKKVASGKGVDERASPLLRSGRSLQAYAAELMGLSRDCKACMYRVAMTIPGDTPNPSDDTLGPCKLSLGNLVDDMQGAGIQMMGVCSAVNSTCFTFETGQSTPQGGSPPSGPSSSDGKGLGAGAILGILAVVGLVAYCGVGVALNASKGERDFPQVLPHWEMWSSLPGIVMSKASQGYASVAAEETMDDALREAGDDENDIIDVIDDAPEVGTLPRRDL
eukprot:TRINITY_DN9945_c0_g1_i1.p1 TRINITY_DN9945_c0_g1~~TRINITY_DN9945_c0_g1_i1.p1  ORF type:complete len:1163 (+),score=295.39 TRINITY_DN9945_c0_g1_i1:87-3575(+)